MNDIERRLAALESYSKIANESIKYHDTQGYAERLAELEKKIREHCHGIKTGPYLTEKATLNTSAAKHPEWALEKTNPSITEWDHNQGERIHVPMITAQPSGDDAAVEALSDLINPLYTPRDNARNQLAAIRAGNVPTVKAEPYPGLVGIALYDEQVGMRDAIIARLAADLSQRDENQAMQETVITKLHADLAATTKQLDETLAKAEALHADLAAARESAVLVRRQRAGDAR